MIPFLLCLSSILLAEIDIIDTPTADVVERGYIGLNWRFYNNGLLNYISAGIYKRVNIGASIDINRIFGKENMRITKPSFRGRWRFYDGTKEFPIFIAIGYDGQGYKYDEKSGKYIEASKELYLVTTSKLIEDNIDLTINLGTNYNSTINKWLGFISTSFSIKKIFGIVAEIDSFDFTKDFQLNSGIKIFFTETISTTLFFKDLTSSPERFIQINWIKKI